MNSPVTDSDDMTVNEEKPSTGRPCARPDEDGARHRGTRRPKSTASVGAASSTSSATVIGDVTEQLTAARLASLEARLTAMDNLQELLSTKSAQLIECAARLRETETARQAAERRWELAARWQLTVRSGRERADGAAADAGRGCSCVVDGGFGHARSSVASPTPSEVVSDSSCSDDGEQVGAENGNSCGSCADGCDKRARSRAIRAIVSHGVEVAPEAKAGNASTGGVTAASGGPGLENASFSFRGVVGRGYGPSTDLVEKLMQQNARLKKTLKQMVEHRYRMSVSEYLDWMEQDDIRQQQQYRRVRWQPWKQKLMVNTQVTSYRHDGEDVDAQIIDDDRETDGSSSLQTERRQRADDVDGTVSGEANSSERSIGLP